ncbi:MAG: M16 family metallopeptidase, partial [Flammeovirgaceae bacterium]
DFISFVKAQLDTSKIVFTCVGDLSMEQVVQLAEKHLGHVPKTLSSRTRKKFSGYRPKEVLIQRDVKQARCAMGRAAYRLADEKRSSFYMLTSILGGAGMNSRLNLALREKHGFVYSIGSQFIPFTDTGIFVTSFGTDPSQLKRSVELVKAELQRLCDERLGIKQLANAKEQLLGQIAMAEESNISFMMMMARNLLDLGRVITFEEIQNRISGTTAIKLQELAQEMFDVDQLSYFMMLPKK